MYVKLQTKFGLSENYFFNLQEYGQSRKASVMKAWNAFQNRGMELAKKGLLLTFLTVIGN